MTELADDQYLEWLSNLVGRQSEGEDHFDLLRQLYVSEFVPVVPGDANRSDDGVALRREFLRDHRDISVSRNWLLLECSVLEMLIGLSRHLSFEMDGPVGDWFWHLMDNAGLTRYNNRRFNARRVDEIIERIVWRNYSFDGSGGLFPLKEPREDQHHVELWFQMEAYMLEMS